MCGIETGGTFDFLHGGPGVHCYLALFFHRFDAISDIHILQVGVRMLQGSLLVEFIHPATQLSFFLHQHHLVAGLCRFSRGSNTCQATPHHQQPFGHFLFRLEGLQGLHVPDLGNPHPKVILGHHLGIFFPFRLAPDHLLPEVYSIQYHTRPEVKHILHDPGGAGRDHHCVHRLITVQISLDGLHPCLAAKKIVVLANRWAEFVIGNRGQGFHIQGIPDATALTYINPYFLLHWITSSP